MRATGRCLLALTLIGAGACGRGEEPPSTSVTTVTAGETEQQRREQEQLAKQERQRMLEEEQRALREQERALQEEQRAQRERAAPAGEPRKERPRRSDEAQRAAKAKARAAEQRAAKEKKEKESAPSTEQDEVVIGETRITSADDVPPTALPTPPVAEEPAAPSGAEPYVNHSTVFGDGTSGMYTDGQGTYGGRATWGTGGGVQPYPPAPR